MLVNIHAFQTWSLTAKKHRSEITFAGTLSVPVALNHRFFSPLELGANWKKEKKSINHSQKEFLFDCICNRCPMNFYSLKAYFFHPHN